MADESLQLALARHETDEAFLDQTMSLAEAQGIVLERAFLRRLIGPDPLGLRRFSGSATVAADWPSSRWLPVHLGRESEGALVVDWAHFGDTAPTDPFFELSAMRALNLPFNRLFRWRMRLEDFLRGAQAGEGRAPDGLIFHMSRCGSTLAAQMLASVSSNLVIAEAPPVDLMVQLGDLRGLAALAAAFARSQTDGPRRCFLKLDSWHILALPLFRRAFPTTPWVFLYRDPVEVLVSQARQRGLQTVPGALPAALLGLDGAGALGADEYAVRVLENICQAALDGVAGGGGLVINYNELPHALWTRILPHFGVPVSDADQAAMKAAALVDAKAPYTAFVPDADAKQREASSDLRALAGRRLAGQHRALEALRPTA